MRIQPGPSAERLHLIDETRQRFPLRKIAQPTLPFDPIGARGRTGFATECGLPTECPIAAAVKFFTIENTENAEISN